MPNKDELNMSNQEEKEVETEQHMSQKQLEEALKDAEVKKFYDHEVVVEHFAEKKNKLLRYRTVLGVASILSGLHAVRTCEKSKPVAAASVGLSGLFAYLWWK